MSKQYFLDASLTPWCSFSFKPLPLWGSIAKHELLASQWLKTSFCCYVSKSHV